MCIDIFHSRIIQPFQGFGNYCAQIFSSCTFYWKSTKNWLMIDMVNGTKSSAIIYSIVETAKANNLNPFRYFELLLTEIPRHMEDTDRTFQRSWSHGSRICRRNAGNNLTDNPQLPEMTAVFFNKVLAFYRLLFNY